MIRLEIEMSNEGARELKAELTDVLDGVTDRMKGERTADRSTRVYVILRAALERLKKLIADQDRQIAEERVKKTPRPPTIRELRRRS